MWENAYLSIKNPKASRALKWALDPSRKLLALLHRQLSASEPGAPLDQILDPHLDRHPRQNFSYNEHPANTSTFLCIKLLAVCRTHCSDGFLSTIRPGWEFESQRTADWTTETKTSLFLIMPHLYTN